MNQVELIRLVLKGKNLLPVEDQFKIIRSYHHGHVQAVLATMKQLGMERLISTTPSRERDHVLAMIAARILEPESKLSTTRWWHTTTLSTELGVIDADEDDLYHAMDWLLERQERIEKKLTARHLSKDSTALYDLSSSYFEGCCCPLAALGHNRDRKKGKLQVNYGLLADKRGCPIAVSVFKGNTSDSKTLMPVVERMRDRFGLERFVIVGDRGMISQKQIDALKTIEGMEWITALKSGAIAKLIEGEAIQMDLFDERNLFEFTHPDYPGERLVACLNRELKKLRAHKRRSLLEATVKELEKVRTMVRRGKLKGKGRDEIGVRVGRVINKYKVGKHFVLEIKDGVFDFHINEKKVEIEAALDGIYVIRTSLSADSISTGDVVRNYKDLSRVERAFRCIKTMDIRIRQIRHYTEGRVRAHIFLCMLAYYVQWHMLEAWRPLLFSDEDQEAKTSRDPVAPAKRSKAALKKVHSKKLLDGSEAYSFQSLLQLLSSIVRNVCRVPGAGPDAPTFEIVTTPSAKQQEALDLLTAIAPPVYGRGLL